MKLYKVTLKREQGGKKLDWHKETLVETNRPPKVGEGRALLMEPPIYETVTEVEEIKLNESINQSITATVLSTVEKNRAKFIEEYGKDIQEEKKLFVHWYVNTVQAPLRVLINDLSEFYLHISEDRIIRYLNEQE